MRSVVAEPCHWTVLAYMEILDAARLADAKGTDTRYHDAKLTAAAFADPDRIWQEHRDYRDGVTQAPAAEPAGLSQADHMALALRVQRQLAKAGLIPTSSGAN